VAEVVKNELAPLLLRAQRPDEKKFDLLSVQEVGRRCGVTEPTVREWIETGALPALRPGGGRTYRIRPEDLQTFIEKKGTSKDEETEQADVRRIVEKVAARISAAKK
jgi:excisionase family DNA binding protein